MWGLRSEEAVGQHVLSLDIGLPVVELHPMLRRQAEGTGESHETLEVDAVNRRGRRIRVRATVSAFQHSPGERGGAVLVMDPIEG
jgi:two-component system CheB/CheR fusion protein